MNWLKPSAPTQLSDFTLMCVKDFHTFISTLCWHGAMVSSKTSGVSRASSASGNSHCRQSCCSFLSAFASLLLWDMLDVAEPIQSVVCEKATLLPHPHIFKNVFSDQLSTGLVIWITSTQALTARQYNAASTCNGQALPYINILCKSLK